MNPPKPDPKVSIDIEHILDGSFPKRELAKKMPQPDLGQCSDCGWKGPLSQCPVEEEGDYESGYYTSPVCPACEDGGCLDQYDYSEEQLKSFKLWEKQNEIKSRDRSQDSQHKSLDKGRRASSMDE